MKLTIPDICGAIRLSDYAPEFGEEVIHVWLNPTRSLLSDASRKDRSAGEVYQWYAEIWSKGGDVWTAEEVSAFADAAFERDPQLWTWVVNETARLIVEHRKKKPVTSNAKP